MKGIYLETSTYYMFFFSKDVIYVRDVQLSLNSTSKHEAITYEKKKEF